MSALNRSSDLQRRGSEVKDEAPFRYVHAEIRTQVVVICGSTRHQLDHGGAPAHDHAKIGWNIQGRKLTPMFKLRSGDHRRNGTRIRRTTNVHTWWHADVWRQRILVLKESTLEFINMTPSERWHLMGVGGVVDLWCDPCNSLGVELS